MKSSLLIEQHIPLIHQNFPSLTDQALLHEIISVGQLLEFSSGDVIMNYGSYVKMVPLVLEGGIKVMREGDDGEELLLYFLNAGDTCSMSFTCCMIEKQSSIRTVAEENTKLISIPIKYINDWMNKYPIWRNFVMMSYDSRILELVKTIDNIAFKKMDDRLLDYLEKKSKTSADGNISSTHQEIAYDLNASRETISRLLKQLEKSNLVTLGRNKIQLL